MSKMGLRFSAFLEELEKLHKEEYLDFEEIATIFNWRFFNGEKKITTRMIADVYHKYIG